MTSPQDKQPTGMSPENDPRTGTTDFLIEQSRRMLELYNARQSNADTKIAAIVTAAVALGTLTVSLTNSDKNVNEHIAVAILAFGTASVVLAFVVRLAFGLYFNQGSFLSTQSKEFRNARRQLLNCGAESNPLQTRETALAMWRAREEDSRHMAQAKDRGAAVAASLLGAAIVCAAYLGYKLIM